MENIFYLDKNQNPSSKKELKSFEEFEQIIKNRINQDQILYLKSKESNSESELGLSFLKESQTWNIKYKYQNPFSPPIPTPNIHFTLSPRLILSIISMCFYAYVYLNIFGFIANYFKINEGTFIYDLIWYLLLFIPMVFIVRLTYFFNINYEQKQENVSWQSFQVILKAFFTMSPIAFANYFFTLSTILRKVSDKKV